MEKPFSLTDVKYIVRVTIGSIDPNRPMSDDKKEEQLKSLMSILTDIQKGRLSVKISVLVYIKWESIN